MAKLAAKKAPAKKMHASNEVQHDADVEMVDEVEDGAQTETPKPEPKAKRAQAEAKKASKYFDHR